MQQPIVTNDVVLFSALEESQYFDRKSARKDDKEIAKHISAFANAAGGKLVGNDGLLEWHGSSPSDPKQFYTMK